MKSSQGAPPPSRERIHKSMSVLPAIGNDVPLLNSEAALAAFFDLERRGSGLTKQLSQLARALARTVRRQLEPTSVTDAHVVRNRELEAALIQAIQLGAAQALFATGEVTRELQRLNKLFSAPIPGGDFGGGGASPSPASGHADGSS